MVSHIACPEVTGDNTPATLSRQLVTDLLREDMGFDGLVITDALNMGAITEQYSSGEAAVAALNAGGGYASHAGGFSGGGMTALWLLWKMEN